MDVGIKRNHKANVVKRKRSRVDESLNLLPDDVLLHILTLLRQRISSQTLLRSIGSVSKRFRRLCFSGELWQHDSLLVYVDPKRIRTILSHIPNPSRIQSVEVSQRVMMEPDGVDDACTLARALLTVLEKTPFVTNLGFTSLDLDMASTYNHSLCEILSRLPLKSLCFHADDEEDAVRFSTVCRMFACCPHLASLSAQCVFPTEPHAMDRLIPDLQARCPHLTKLKLENVLNNYMENDCYLDLSPLGKPSCPWKLASLFLELLNLGNVQALSSLQYLQHLKLTECKIPCAYSSSLLFMDCALLCTVHITFDVHSHCHHNLQLVRCPNLESVHMYDSCIESVPPNFRIKVSFQDLPKLHTISIYPITIGICARVTWDVQITHCPNIHSLSLPPVPLSEYSDLQHLASLFTCLDPIDNTALSNAAFASTLTRLRLTECSSQSSNFNLDYPSLQKLMVHFKKVVPHVDLHCPVLHMLNIMMDLPTLDQVFGEAPPPELPPRNSLPTFGLSSCSTLTCLYIYAPFQWGVSSFNSASFAPCLEQMKLIRCELQSYLTANTLCLPALTELTLMFTNPQPPVFHVACPKLQKCMVDVW
eukprot:CAMPEP_0184660140 /NCGR_PEP_ID=MMETSP0308-20130426/32589_1 /TAXON_ID=38269 /ORGANISM="Gloeochaete witrockiana, Strain SAG 46.84" /LENGTH=590 /DNA_ID=CAMNT_0027100503 /DNA_START=100 /DNA_END=1869 /DNA_ORIENTATION=+